jgi:lipopolysaccharide transport system ATP-binding protein
MTEIALEGIEVSKKFRKGESYDSLRDFIPALIGRTFKNSTNGLRQREFWALKDVCFEVRKGEAFGFIGPNGAGKSTMLKILSGIMKPTKGRISVNGRLSALIEVGAGFHYDLTGRENIFLSGAILGMRREEIKNKFDEIVEFSGLEEFIDTPVKRYSSGMYARLGFAVAAHVSPDVLIVDEVLSVGDYLFQKKCVNKMDSIIKSGATVIFVSHNLKAVSDLCKRTLLLDHGRGIKEGPTDEVIKFYLDRMSGDLRDTLSKKVVISKVSTRNKNGESIHFESGEKAWIDIEVTAQEGSQELGIALELKDNDYYTIFDTSAYRLGVTTFSLLPGQIFRVTFEIDLHLVSGTYHLGVIVAKYGILEILVLDTVFPAITLFVKSDKDIRGVANLYPKVLMQEEVL